MKQILASKHYNKRFFDLVTSDSNESDQVQTADQSEAKYETPVESYEASCACEAKLKRKR